MFFAAEAQKMQRNCSGGIDISINVFYLVKIGFYCIQLDLKIRLLRRCRPILNSLCFFVLSGFAGVVDAYPHL